MEIKELSLYDYLTIAKKCIGYFTKSYIAYRMLRDEDAISFVAEYIMIGAQKWQDGKGRTLHSFLNQYAWYGIHKWLKMQSEQKHMQRFNHYDSYGHNNTPISILIQQEEHDILNEHLNKLTDKESLCIREYFFGGQNMPQIAETLNVSRQAVEQNINRGLKKLKYGDLQNVEMV